MVVHQGIRIAGSSVAQVVRSFSTDAFVRRSQRMTKGIVSPRLTIPNHINPPEYWKTGRPAESPDYVVGYAEEDIPKLRRAARLARKVLEFCLSKAQPGITTDEIDRLAHEEMLRHGAYPSPMNYRGFPKSICTSVNDVICHGIPDSTVLQEGDTISIDVSLYLDGFHGDNCGATNVGTRVDPKLDKLIAVTKEAVDKAIAVCGPGKCISGIGKVIEDVARKNNYCSVKNFCGHGTGVLLHMQPFVSPRQSISFTRIYCCV